MLQVYHWTIQAPQEMMFMRGNPMRGPLIRGTLLLTLAAAMFTVSLPADAGGGHRHHHRARVGVTIGAPVLLAPLWVSPYPYYYYHYYPAPVVVRERVIVREPLVFYDEQGRPAPPESRSAAGATTGTGANAVAAAAGRSGTRLVFLSGCTVLLSLRAKLRFGMAAGCAASATPSVAGRTAPVIP